uniref:Histidine--tRNA ligase n=1 Tax=Magnetococcus massalia (strain MO-1) TaxID=451514 RepID=A0A1S7LNN3_MAGMO|nr:Histidyl-tRNA synthetase [Candidatus Magnetococcus massalia]
MIKPVRGVRDILPDETSRWQFLESTLRTVFGRYGFGELRLPLFEKSELFARAVGETTDIVEKEMYVFEDRGGESLSLRPEGTASAVRSFINNGFDRQLPWKAYYIGPMFRYERPQKGRYRQFHQAGAELFGPEGPLADAEMMAMVLRALESLGLSGRLTLEINSLGCPACRPAYREKLIAYLQREQEELCGNCQNRMERNPLRVLDCKNPTCKEIAQAAPKMLDHLCEGCETHFSGLKGHLDALELPYRINSLMVRGLDYYSRTAFEVTTQDLGAQNAVAAGGRYDGLVAEMGGKPMPAIGFAMGLERLVLLMDESLGTTAKPDLYMVALGDAATSPAFAFAEKVRGLGMRVEMGLQGGSMKSQMKKAGRSEATWCAIVGESEAESGQVVLKNMAEGEQDTLCVDDALARLNSAV